MIQSIKTGGSSFVQAFTSFTSNFYGKTVESIDQSFSGSQMKQVAKIVIIVAGIALAAFGLLWMIRRCCFQNLNQFPPDSPYRPKKIDDSPNTFVQNSEFNLPQEARQKDLETWLEKAIGTLEEIDQKIGPLLAGRWKLSQKERDAFLYEIQSLKAFDQDYQKFERYADRINLALKPYQDYQEDVLPASNDLLELMQRVYGKELGLIYARLAEKYFAQRNLDKCMLMALKIQYNEEIRDGILLEVAAQYLKDNKQAEAQLALSKAGASPKKDQISYDYLLGLMDSGKFSDALKIVGEMEWVDSHLADKLIRRYVEKLFSSYNKRQPSYFDYHSVLRVLYCIIDKEMKDQLLVHMGKVLYKDGESRLAHYFFEKMTYNIPLRDRLLYNVDHSLPI